RCDDQRRANLIGEWELTRNLAARTLENSAQAEWVLNHQFLQLRMKDVKSPPAHEALVLIGYEHDKDRYVIYWLDSFGGKFSEKGYGKRKGDSIKFEFKYPDGL